MKSDLRMRVASAAASLLAVAPLAVLARHDLVHSKPYRETLRPLADALAALGPWILVLVFGAALLVVAIFRARVLALSPLVAVFVGAAVALASFQVAFGSVSWVGSDFPAGRDLGVGTVAATFNRMVRVELIRGLAIGAVGAAVLTYFAWRGG